MKHIVQVNNLSLFNMRKWFSDPRMLMLVLAVLVTIYSGCDGILRFSQTVGIPVNGFGILPHLYNNRFYRLFIQFGIVLLFCNAPFSTANSVFIIIRTGYRKWFVGQVMYILTASFIYTCFIFLSTLIPILSNITFQTTWGSVLSTLSQVSNNATLNFQFGLQQKYDVITALMHTFLLLFLFSFLLGMIMFFLNSFINKASGMIVSTLIILVSLVPDWTQYPMLIRRISPSSLTQIMELDIGGVSNFPTIEYAYMVLMAIISILVVLSFTTIGFKLKPYRKFKENMGGRTYD